MNYPKLSHPPVLEAVIGISISNNEHWQKYYEDVVELIKSDYSIVNERISFRIKGKTPQSGDNELLNEPQVIKDGYILSNPETKKSVLLKPDSIQLTKKAPYIEWNELFSDFIKAIESLNSIAPHLLYNKPYLRYRNLLSIKYSNEPIEEYLNIVHNVPEVLTNFNINNLFFNADMFDEPYNCKIEQGMKPSKKEMNTVDTSINIEVINTRIETTNISELFASFENLRYKKNEIFFSLITEKTKQLFV